MILVELPRSLHVHARGSPVLRLEHDYATVGEALASLGDHWPGVRDRVLDERGRVRQHVNVFVETESIRFLLGLDTPLTDGATIVIVPAVSGG
jgi:molybdopterin converting factor small subunit